MSRQMINRLLLGLFVFILLGMSVVYMRQEHTIRKLEQEKQDLELKQEKIEYIINEYLVLIDNVDSRNFIIRMAREKFGWVFDNEKVYIKGNEQNDSLLPKNSPQPSQAIPGVNE